MLQGCGRSSKGDGTGSVCRLTPAVRSIAHGLSTVAPSVADVVVGYGEGDWAEHPLAAVKAWITARFD